MRRLRFLAAKAAAHAAHAARHERVGQRQNAGDDVLHVARMLGGRIDQHRAVLAGHGHRDLAFQIKVLLAADMQRAGGVTRRPGDRLCRVAVDERVIGQHALAGGLALLDGNVRLFGIDLDLAEQRRAPGGVARRGDHREYRLAVEIHAVMREHRLVGVPRRNIVLSRYVRRGDDGDDARRAQHLGKIDPPNRAARHRRTADGDMHGADRLRHIVDILGRALHVLGAAVVRQRLVHMAQRRF